MSFKDQINTFSHQGADRVLDALGLERKREPTDYLLPALGIFGAGLVVGAALGLLFAPKPGSELRHDIADRVQHLRHKDEEGAHPNA